MISMWLSMSFMRSLRDDSKDELDGDSCGFFSFFSSSPDSDLLDDAESGVDFSSAGCSSFLLLLLLLQLAVSMLSGGLPRRLFFGGDSSAKGND